MILKMIILLYKTAKLNLLQQKWTLEVINSKIFIFYN